MDLFLKPGKIPMNLKVFKGKFIYRLKGDDDPLDFLDISRMQPIIGSII